MKNIFQITGVTMTALMLVASTAHARGWHGEHGSKHGFGVHKILKKLDLPDDVQAAIRERAEASKPAFRTLHERKHAKKQRLHELIHAESPNKAAILEHVEAIGALKTELRKNQMELMLDIATMLSPEQREQVKGMFKEHRKSGHGKFKEKRCGSDGCGCNKGTSTQ